MKVHSFFWLACLVFTGSFAGNAEKVDAQFPQNIIFIVVDGMGPGQIEAAEIFLGDKKLRFREFPYQGSVTTHNSEGHVTDSAAAATAMSTGHKVKNGVISKNTAGDGAPFLTMLERAKSMGKSTGLVTTTPFTDATPAAFGSHANDRSDTKDILETYFQSTLPNVIFGADEPTYRESVARAKAPYMVATSKRSLLKHTKAAEQIGPCELKDCPRVYGGFGSHPMLPGFITSWESIPLEAESKSYFSKHDIPHLSEMASSALSILSQNKNGFFLMLESGLIDWIGHRNRTFNNDQSTHSAFALGKEFEELNRTLDIMLQFLEKNPDTLIVLTADHETGGLTVDRNSTTCLGKIGCLAQLNWTSSLKLDGKDHIASHTNANVGVFATGKNAHVFASASNLPMDNTDFVSKIFQNATP